jgi:LysM repeat protein
MRFVYIAIILSIVSCSTISKGYQRNNTKIQKRAARSGAPLDVKYTPDEYIARFSTIAIREMTVYGIPASITLAQGILESGSGSSDLAKFANNHFGIKCTTDWKGLVYYKNDDRKNDCFRVYDNPDLSFEDHSKFLQRPRYESLFLLDTKDYQSWAYGLKNAGYATLPEYPELLIGLIEKYNLDQFDKTSKPEEQKKEVESIINKELPTDTIIVAPVVENIPIVNPTEATTITYVVAEGDTIYGISRKFGISIESLIELNTLDNSNISIGQVITIKKY